MNRVEYWKSIERIRRNLLPSNLRTMTEAFRGAVEPIRNALDEASNTDMSMMAIEQLDSDAIRDGYEKLYVNTIPHFARKTFRELNGKSEKDAEDVWIENARKYIQSGVIADRITMVSETTKSQVRTIIQRGIEEGMSVQDIARDIDKLGMDRIIPNRSLVVSRTETINASNRGSIEGAKETGLELQKEWISTPDGRTRDDHIESDGQTVPMNERFLVGGEELEYPGDPAGSARNVINCRCTQAFIPQ